MSPNVTYVWWYYHAMYAVVAISPNKNKRVSQQSLFSIHSDRFSFVMINRKQNCYGSNPVVHRFLTERYLLVTKQTANRCMWRRFILQMIFGWREIMIQIKIVPSIWFFWVVDLQQLNVVPCGSCLSQNMVRLQIYNIYICSNSSSQHYSDNIMGAMASQITSLNIVYSTVYSKVDQRKHQSSTSPAFVRGIHRWPVNSPHKGPVTRKIFPFDEVIITFMQINQSTHTTASYANKLLFVSVVNPIVYAISFTPHDRQLSYEGDEEVPNLVDGFPETCDDVSNRKFINIIWELSAKTNMARSTVTIKGSQQCRATNMIWFIGGSVPGPLVMECDVTEEQVTGLRKCKLLCKCAPGAECGFLHFRAQHPPWLEETLSLCHFEEHFTMLWCRNIICGASVKPYARWIHIPEIWR